MSKMTIAQAQASHPLDLSALDNVTDPKEYDRVLHDAIRNQLKAGGLISPTENTTNFELEHENTISFFEDMARKVVKAFPAVFDDPNEGGRRYMEERFKRITAHEGWVPRVEPDVLHFKSIGYGFNMDEPTNRKLFKQALKSDDKHFDDLREGRKELSRREGRILFEAAVGQAEKLISHKFSDVDLKSYQRMALVSLAYNHPSLIGPNLTRHIKSGNFEAAKDEILNRSNKYKLKGIQNRRIDEANLFSGMYEDEGDTGFSLASFLGISEAQATTKSDDNIKFPRPKMKPITNFGNLETTVQSSAEDADDDGFFDKAVKMASEFADTIKDQDFTVVPTPVVIAARAAFDTFTGNDTSKVTYRKSDIDFSTQQIIDGLYKKALASGRDFTIVDDYPKLQNGLSVRALLGDGTKWDKRKKDYVRNKDGSIKVFPDLKKQLRQERERYYPSNFAGILRMFNDMQKDPVFRAAGSVGMFSIQRSAKGDFIRERWNFNKRNVLKAGSKNDLFGLLLEAGTDIVGSKETEGPLVLYPLSGNLTISDLEKGGKI